MLVDLWLITILQSISGGAEAGGEGLGADDGGVRAPAQDPAFGFFDTVQAQPEADLAAWQFGDFLAGVPFTAADQVGPPRIKIHDDFVIGIALKNRQATFQIFGEVKFLGNGEPLGGDFRRFQARQGKRAHGVAFHVKGEQIPVVINAAEVIRMDQPGLRFFRIEVAVLEFQDAALFQGAGEHFKGFEVGVLWRERSKRQRLVEAAEGKSGFGIQLAGQAFEGHRQGLFEGRAAILRDGFVGDQQGKHFGFGERQMGKLVHRLGVVIAVALLVEFHGQIQPALHEIHIAHDGAPRDFKLLGDPVAIGIGLLLQQVVETHHALHGRAAVSLRFGFGHKSFSVYEEPGHEMIPSNSSSGWRNGKSRVGKAARATCSARFNND